VLTPGDRVEATGFIDTRRNVAGLSGALIRRTGTAAPPAPEPITMPEISGIFALMKACLRDGMILQPPTSHGPPSVL
jgi:hypothetical protein